MRGTMNGIRYCRDWVVATAQRLGLTGWVRNRTDGSVEALIVGNEEAVGQMIQACRSGPPMARVDEIDRETRRLVNEAEAIEAKGDTDLRDLARLTEIETRMEKLVAEMKGHHRALTPSRSLLDRILRR